MRIERAWGRVGHPARCRRARAFLEVRQTKTSLLPDASDGSFTPSATLSSIRAALTWSGGDSDLARTPPYLHLCSSFARLAPFSLLLRPHLVPMSPRVEMTHVGHDASKQWNAVEDQYEIDVARCYQKWGRRMPPRSKVADYLRWDSMREDELDRLKAKRDRALKAIPMDTTPSVPPKSPPPSRPRRPISPPSAYPLSPLMSTVVDTQIPLRSPSRSETVETLDTAVDFTRAARLARAPSVTSITSSVAHCEWLLAPSLQALTADRKASMTRTLPTTAPSSPTMADIPLSPMSSCSAGDTRAAARARVFNSVLYAAQSSTTDLQSQQELRRLAKEFDRLNR